MFPFDFFEKKIEIHLAWKSMNEHNFLAVSLSFTTTNKFHKKFGNGNNLWPKRQSFLLFEHIYYTHTYFYVYMPLQHRRTYFN